MSTILIVDDEPTIVDLLEEHLQSEGYETSHAYSGEEALQTLDNNTPDLIILDLMLPGMDGYEVCRLMQQDPRLNHIPVIMLTARSAVPNKVLGYQRGADDYIVKPFDPDELSVRVRAQLRHLYHDSVSELTGLPGSQAVQDKIAEVTSGEPGKPPKAIMYANITGFTAFNEAYSFTEGDDMIKVAARALDRAIQEAGSRDDFLGHVSGDEFVVVTSPGHVEGIRARAQHYFTENIRDFYTPTDRDQGYFVTIDHQGLLSHIPLCTLDFDAVLPDTGD